MAKKRSRLKKSKIEKSSRGATSPQSLAGVILCGGKGTRMGLTTSHKVCVPIAGRAAIVRLVDTLRADGVDPIVVVVGYRCGDVIETLSAVHPGIHFVYQRDQLGTGHAARIGVEALAHLGYDGLVLVTMGDKWFAPGLVKGVSQHFRHSGADLLAVSTPKRPESTAGRLVEFPDRGVVGIVERRDIERLRVLEAWQSVAESKKSLMKSNLRKTGLEFIRPARKLWRALGPLSRFCRGSGALPSRDVRQAIQEAGTTLPLGDRRLSADAIETMSPTVNESVYLARMNALAPALRKIGRANAQDEYYLTDIVEILQREADPDTSAAPRVILHTLAGRDLMAFNTRKELKRIEDHVRELERDPHEQATSRKLRAYSRRPQDWQSYLKSPRAAKRMERVYGDQASALLRERLRAMKRVVRLFARHFGSDQPCLLVRAPGRINLMGRHVDHQGGYVHVVALSCEVLMAVSPRQDDVIRLVNDDPVAFPNRELVISDWAGALRSRDWLSFVDGDEVKHHLSSTAGDWSNYVLASALYQRFHHPERRLRGMDVAVLGNVPMASGLSSSSSLVVATMEAINAVNGIGADGPAVVNACGEAEWFVGSRGGAADHAAIRLGRAGHAARIGFHPFRMEEDVPLPEEAALLVAYSGEHAVKSAGARDRFNERVANYRLGIELLRKKHPQYASRLKVIRDLTPDRLGVSAHRVHAMIEGLPNRITRQELMRRLGRDGRKRVESIFTSHADPGAYTVRDVVAYGVGECERSRLAEGWLREGDLEQFGIQMVRSHDGDRVYGRRRTSERGLAARLKTSPDALADLIGDYACSTRRIDELVDMALEEEGVFGAQIAGAGLGGCVMILAHRRAVSRVVRKLKRDFYEASGLEPAIWSFRSVHGGGVVRP